MSTLIAMVHSGKGLVCTQIRLSHPSCVVNAHYQRCPYAFSLKIKIVLFWNRFPTNVREAATLSAFKVKWNSIWLIIVRNLLSSSSIYCDRLHIYLSVIDATANYV